MSIREINGWCFDLEADGLYLQCSKVWYGRFKSLDGTKSMVIRYTDSKEEVYAKVSEWVHSFEDGCYVVGFNHVGYDLWVLWKLFGIVPRVGKGGDWLDNKPVVFIDGLLLSQYLTPDLPSHSLATLSAGNDNEKIDYRAQLVALKVMVGNEPKGFEFSFYHPLMDVYCDGDVDATIGVVEGQWNKAISIYGEKWLHPSFRQLTKDYWLYCAQAFTGVKFNRDKAEALVKHVGEEMEKIKANVDPHLPARQLKTAEKAFYKIPAKPFTKSGEMSSTLLKWLEKHSAHIEDGNIIAYGMSTKLIANEILPVTMPMEIEDNTELKQYFLDSGWVPHEDFWNFKKGSDGKPERDMRGKYIKTTPKIQNAGKICPNLLKLNGKIPAQLVKYLSYRNRKGVVEGWLNNWRLDWDGRISAEMSGYTPTFRAKHRTVVNCPKASEKILLGSEMRDLFTVEGNNWYVGTDAAALENRTVAAYTMKYDGGQFADIVLNGDSHTHNAFAFFPEIVGKFDPEEDGLKDKHEFKPYRDKAKTGAYLLAYGGGVNKLASSLGLSKQEAQRSYDNYWKSNPGLGKLKDNVEKYYDTTGGKKHIPAWDGRMLCARGKNVLINLAGQSCGAIAMSYAACFMDNWLGELYIDDMGRPYYLYKDKVAKRVSMVHDEYSWEVEDGIEDDIRLLSVKAIEKAGSALKLPLILAGEGKMSKGGSWRDVH